MKKGHVMTAAALFLLLATPAFADRPAVEIPNAPATGVASVRGLSIQVIDVNTELGISGAVGTLWTIPSLGGIPETVATATTGRSGVLYFRNGVGERGDAYNLVVDADGYTSSQMTVSVGAALVTWGQAVLQPTPQMGGKRGGELFGVAPRFVPTTWGSIKSMF